MVFYRYILKNVNYSIRICEREFSFYNISEIRRSGSNDCASWCSKTKITLYKHYEINSHDEKYTKIIYSILCLTAIPKGTADILAASTHARIHSWLFHLTQILVETIGMYIIV